MTHEHDFSDTRLYSTNRNTGEIIVVCKDCYKMVKRPRIEFANSADPYIKLLLRVDSAVYRAVMRRDIDKYKFTRAHKIWICDSCAKSKGLVFKETVLKGKRALCGWCSTYEERPLQNITSYYEFSQALI